MKDKFVLVLSYIHLLYSVGIVLSILLGCDDIYHLDEFVCNNFGQYYRYEQSGARQFIIAYHFVTFLLGSLFYWKSSRNFTILSIVALVPVIVPLFRIEEIGDYDDAVVITIYIIYLLLLIALGIRKDINTITNKPTKQ